MPRFERRHDRERALSSLGEVAAYLAEALLVETEGIHERMSALDDAVANITTSVQSLGTDLARLVTDFEAAQAANNPQAIANATAAITALSTTLQTFDASIVTADPPPATPTP